MDLFICELITWVVLGIILLCPIGVLVKMSFSSRGEKLKYLRNFKKGRFAFIYISMLPLYVIAFLYAKNPWYIAIFKSITKLVNLVVLKYEYGEIIALIEASQIYNFTLHLGFVFVALNALLFTISLVHQHISNAFHLMYLRHTKRPRLYIFGEKPENANIYFSDEKRVKIMIGDLDDKEKEALFYKKIFYHKENNYKDFIANIFKGLKKSEIVVIINEEASKKNLELCKYFIEQINLNKDDRKLLKRLNVFVFGDPAYEEVYLDLINQGLGRMRYVDVFHQISVDFIDKYPLSSFLTSKNIDYSTSLLKPETDINVIFIGFGYTNRQIFLTSVANNQFLTKVQNEIKLKPVNYYIIDKEPTKSDKNLNHDYYRYKFERADFNPQNYLELPDLPANEFYTQINVNDWEFYGEIKKIICKNPNAINVVLISLGDELVNLDISKKLCVKRDEWAVANCNIFCKNATEKTGAEVEGNSNCYYFGNETEVYNIDNIMMDSLTEMALLRNTIYDVEYAVKHQANAKIDDEFIEECKRKAEEKWFNKKLQSERESNLYCCLSLRSKLNLLGFDYCDESDERPAVSYDDFMMAYAKEDMPNVEHYDQQIDGKYIIKYDLDYKQSTRKNLAVLEHYRWNSFMITQGFIPATIDQIKHETVLQDDKMVYTNGKNYYMRRHGNLTTFDGLEKFSKIVAQRDKLSLIETDVISYDYQIMDDAYWLITKLGKKIVKRQ